MDNRQAIKAQVIGFLVPIFQQENPDTGKMMHGLGRLDFEKVREGFACADCLAEFTTYTIHCPVCGLYRDVSKDIKQAPSLWVEHLRDHHEDRTPYTVSNTFDEALALKMQDKDMEQIPVSKLRKSRWGRG